MNIRNSASIALWSAVVLSTNVIAKDIAIYRWVDENNVVHFSQHQPKDENYTQLTTVSSYRAKEKAQPQRSKLPSVGEQIEKHEKEKAEILAKNQEIAEKNCEAARLNEKTLSSSNNVMFTDPDGKNRALSDKEKKEQLALSKEQIKQYCLSED